MPPFTDHVRATVDGTAALGCLFMAGGALACLQSDHGAAAEALAVTAACIPAVALLLRLRSFVADARRRRTASRTGRMAPGPG